MKKYLVLLLIFIFLIFPATIHASQWLKISKTEIINIDNIDSIYYEPGANKIFFDSHDKGLLDKKRNIKFKSEIDEDQAELIIEQTLDFISTDKKVFNLCGYIEETLEIKLDN